MRRATLILLLTIAIGTLGKTTQAAAEGETSDWGRFSYYPYVYYPHNFQTPQRHNSLYNRHPQARLIPVYDKSWYNFHPEMQPHYLSGGAGYEDFTEVSYRNAPRPSDK